MSYVSYALCDNPSLCWWPRQAALPAKGKEYPCLGYKRLQDRPPKAHQQQQPVVAYVRAISGQAPDQLQEQVPAAQVRDGCLGDWDVCVHGLVVQAERVGYVNGLHSWLHRVGQEGIPKFLRQVVDEVLQLGPGHALSILAAVGTAVVLSWSWKAGEEAAALKQKQQEAELSSNTESLRMQIQRLHTCLANDAFVLELPGIKDIDVDPNETPTAQASQLLAAAAGPALPVLEGPMKAEWDRFMASSKISLVQDLWDSHSAVDKPRASLAKLEEMSQRVRNANHSTGSSKAEAACVDPFPLHGKAVSDRRLGRLHWEGQAAVLCSQQPSSRQQDPVSPSSHASRPSEPAETGHLGNLQGPHLPQQSNSDHKLQHGIQAPASEGDGASAEAMQPAMPGGTAQLVMPSKRASHQAGPEGALSRQLEQAQRKQAGTSGSAPSLSHSRIRVVGLSSSSLGALAAEEAAKGTTADLHIS
ncbi:hypothetical protein QJQ45_027739 [Haematococcus lacustris]|nr:hypothetical protein QJQ45_027739 [Haematococcus lacustris]